MKHNKLFSLILMGISTLFLVSCNNLNISSSNNVSTSNDTSSFIQSETSADFSRSGTMDIDILSTNDIHGYIEQDTSGKGGSSNMAYLMNQIRNTDTYDNTILIGSGDMFQGTAISNKSHGESVIDVMNEMDYDCMVLGNHEFDWGINTILNYFDDNEANGEADFPLVNSNVYRDNNTLLDNNTDKILSSYIIEKEAIKIGVIGLIGDVSSSIITSKLDGYYFDTDFTETVLDFGGNLKDQGCNIIVVSIHGGTSNDISTYTVNQALASLTYNGRYLVDCVLNGHTHYNQYGTISRSGGVSMPVVQGGGNGASFGKITLTFNYDSAQVTSTAVRTVSVSSAGSNYVSSVEAIIDYWKTNLPDTNLAIMGETITYTSDVKTWAANVMLKSMAADFAFSNNGGLRTIDVTAGEYITDSDLYALVPFDNAVVRLTMSGSSVKSLINNSSLYYSGVTSSANINNSTIYDVAMIDYVFYNYYLPTYISSSLTPYYYRDLLMEDVDMHSTFSPYSNPEALIAAKY